MPTWKATRYIHLWTLRLFFASATRSQRDEEWQKLGAANMWPSTSRSAVDRCEESPSELSPGFARYNIKMTTARTERNCLWTLKCVTRSVMERRGLKILHFLWKLKHWMILSDVVFYRRCSVLLNGSVFLLTRLFTKLAATILQVCKLVSLSLSGRLRKSYSKFSRRSIVMIWISTAIPLGSRQNILQI